MALGICFLTYNAEDTVERSLACAKIAAGYRPHEIVVVDNASGDNTAAVVRAMHPDVHLICNPRNTGYAAGNNVGADYLSRQGCDTLAFVNPDVFLRPDTFAAMEAALASTPQAGCAGGIPETNGHISSRSFRRKPAFLDMLVVFGWSRYFPVLRRLLDPLVKRLEAAYYLSVDQSAGVQQVYAVSGACIMFPAASFKAIGGFDEHTFLFMEEVIVSERLSRIGQTVIGVPRAVYVHKKSSSVSRYPLRINYCYIRSEFYTARRYFGWPLWKMALLTGAHLMEFLLHALIRLVRIPKRASARVQLTADHTHDHDIS